MPSFSQLAQVFTSSRVRVDTRSFGAFAKTFPLQGEALFTHVFKRHTDIIQTQKAKFAVANLEKILTTTFEISTNSGFSRMSLRDLSKSTGMSMGAIYSCIGKKEDIVLMVADVVRLSGEMTRQHASSASSYWSQIEQSIRFHLYASTLLQPWYFFLYFETRSLPEGQQKVSTLIELDAIDGFTAHIEAGVKTGEFSIESPRAVANAIVVMLEDWYLKPWKNQLLKPGSDSLDRQNKIIEAYYQDLTSMVKSMLQVKPI